MGRKLPQSSQITLASGCFFLGRRMLVFIPKPGELSLEFLRELIVIDGFRHFGSYQDNSTFNFCYIRFLVGSKGHKCGYWRCISSPA
jgi:hypothetical protein